MKFQRAIVLIAALVLFSGSALMAGGPMEPTIRVKIPFAFVVGNTLLPAGEYRVAHVHNRDTVLLRGVNNMTIVLIRSVASGKQTGDIAKLVFYRYGDGYFLRQVWIPGLNANNVPQSKTENRYAEQYARQRSGPEQTTVVAAMDK